MPSHEEELDQLLNASIRKPPADFLNKVMQQVDSAPTAQLVWQGIVHQHIYVENRLKTVALNLTKLAAFVFRHHVSNSCCINQYFFRKTSEIDG